MAGESLRIVHFTLKGRISGVWGAAEEIQTIYSTLNSKYDVSNESLVFKGSPPSNFKL
jgi:hypothetical protein